MFLACHDEAEEKREVANEFSHTFSAQVCKYHAKLLDQGTYMTVLFQKVV